MSTLATWEAETAAGNGAPCDRNRVLVVDDERAIRLLFQLILSEELPGREVDVASNGQEAFEAFQCRHHAVLLMDLHMPVMDGQQAFREIDDLCRRENLEMPSFVFCTGYAPPDELRNVIESSSRHGLLSKPVGTADLVRAVRERLM